MFAALLICSKAGGDTSLSPPVGAIILAQELKSKKDKRKKNRLFICAKIKYLHQAMVVATILTVTPSISNNFCAQASKVDPVVITSSTNKIC